MVVATCTTGARREADMPLSLHDRLKAAFREFATSERARQARAEGWWPEAADLADVAESVLRDVLADDVVIDLRDRHDAPRT